MPEEAQIGRDAGLGSFNLASTGLTAELPSEFADLGERLGGDGFAKAGEATAGVHRDSTAEGGLSVAQQLFRVSLFAQAYVFAPVKL